jgi:hypothetical protein
MSLNVLQELREDNTISSLLNTLVRLSARPKGRGGSRARRTYQSLIKIVGERRGETSGEGGEKKYFGHTIFH